MNVHVGTEIFQSIPYLDLWLIRVFSRRGVLYVCMLIYGRLRIVLGRLGLWHGTRHPVHAFVLACLEHPPI